MTLIQKIRKHLIEADIPDFSFIYSDDSLDVATELLEILLEEEKKYFQELIDTPLEKINYEMLDRDELLEYYF